MRKFFTGISLVVVLGIPVAYAVEYSGPTEAELSGLPPFCAVKMRAMHGDPEAPRIGESMIGSQFGNAHHYCFGLNYLNRYNRAPYAPGAKSNLAIARGDLNYMVEHLHTNSSLAGESYLYLGIVNSLLKNDAEALLDLMQAVSRNPRLVKAHLTLADYYSERKQQAKALEVVTEGLRHVPDSKPLKRRYQELGGKLPYPEPLVVSPEPVAKAEKPAEDVNANNPTNQPVTELSKKMDLPVEKARDKEDAVKGTPKNPYCRFCPPEE
jgi:tetratricopeptide (TPR) repeat protein